MNQEPDEKVWFLLCQGRVLGPFSLLELKENPDISPDTLAWREGFTSWKPIREIKELASLFEEEEPVQEREEEESSSSPSQCLYDVMVLQKSPFYPYIWLWLALALALYFWYLKSHS